MLSELLAKAGLPRLWTEESEITGVTNDSRRCKGGELYVCTVGDLERGEIFSKSAVENGAQLVLSAFPFEGVESVVVEDVRDAYSRLAAAFYDNPQNQLTMIGVTGTNGKTSTSWMIGWILQYCGYNTGVLGTVSNRLPGKTLDAHHTTPDSSELFMMLREMVEAGCTHCVMEVSSHGLCQKRTAPIAFEVGVFTNLTQDHLDYHHTMSEYLAAKRILFTQSGIAVANQDSPYCEGMLEGFQGEVASYSLREGNSFSYGSEVHCTIQKTAFTAVIDGHMIEVTVPVIGDYNAYNALAAITAAVKLGIPAEKAAEALSKFEGVPGRIELIYKGKYTIIRDYAHTPDALEKLLKALRPLVKKRLIVLFGCGGDRDKTKRPIMARAAEENSDITIVTSDNPRTEGVMDIIRDIKQGLTSEGRSTIIIPDRFTAIEYGIGLLREDDTLVLAGKGHEDYQILADKIISFDEKKIVTEILNRR